MADHQSARPDPENLTASVGLDCAQSDDGRLRAAAERKSGSLIVHFARAQGFPDTGAAQGAVSGSQLTGRKGGGLSSAINNYQRAI